MSYSIDIALKMIPEFAGDRNELHKFITCGNIVNAMCTTNTAKSSLINIVKTKLSGSAYDIIKYKQFDSWDDLRAELEKQYGEKRSIAQIQSELLNIHQGKDNVRDFANKIIKLKCDLDDACIKEQGINSAEIVQNLNRHAALKAFVDGLNNPIKLIIKASRFEDLHQAIEAACEEEKCITNNKNQESVQNCSCSKNNSRPKPNNYHQNYPLQNSNFANNYNNFNQSRPFNNYNQNYALRTNPNFANSYNNYSQQSNFCRYCKKGGHTLEMCRRRAYNNSRGQYRETYNQNRSHSQPSTSSNSGNDQNPRSESSGTRIGELNRTAQ